MSTSPTSYPPIKTRHLCFFLLPVVGKGDLWKRNLDELKARIDLFNGRRRLCIVQNSRDRNLALEHPVVVQHYARDLDCEFVTVDNDPNLREVTGWEPLLEPLRTTRDDEAIFWGHGKATTHGPAGTCWRWAQLMYRALLRWDWVEPVLQRHPIAGCFKGHPLEPFESRPTSAAWEYHGGMYWLRSTEFFRRNWRAIERNWTGTETAPGVLYRPEEGGMIFPEKPIGLKETMYLEDDMRKAEMEFAEFSRLRPEPQPVQPTATPTAGFPPIRLRHLAYVILPVSRNGIWQKNLDQFIPHLPLFNGRRRVAILTGSAGRNFVLDPPERVRDYLRGHDIEFMERPNNSLLREGEVWQDLFGPLQGAGEDEACLFAHAKGVTRVEPQFAGAHRWTRVLYCACLDHWPQVEQLLAKFPIAGPMKHTGRNYFRTPSKFQFLGSFYWVRLAEMFRRDWRRLDLNWGAVETWPGLHFRVEEGGAIWPPNPVPDGEIYSNRYWDAMEPEFGKWEKSLMPRTLPQQAIPPKPTDWHGLTIWETSLSCMAATGRYSTDKNSTHSYLQNFYDGQEFANVYGLPVRLLEVGVRTGGSLKLWRDHFARSGADCQIHGCDLNFRQLEPDVRGSERIHLHQTNGYDPAFAAKFDALHVCIDDGSHRLEDQVKFVQLYWPLIERDGWLIVEDVQDPAHFEILKQALPERDRWAAKCLDLRHVKGRHDDLLFAVERMDWRP